jgi:glycosyltransferase involved in cell wall biosynthesis
VSKSKVKNQTEEINISIVICTHNRASLLEITLESLEKMYVPNDTNIELIIVNNRCNDSTPKVIEHFEQKSKKIRVRSLYEPKLGKVHALKNAIKNSLFDVLAFIDDDHIVDESYVRAIRYALENNSQYSIYCGRVMPDWDGSEPQWVHDDSKYPIRPYPIPQFDLGERPIEIKEDKTFLPGSGNLVMKKDVFGRIGLFSEELGPKGHNLKGGEDIELVRRALRKGERILYVPRIVQHHQVFPEHLRIQYLVKKAYHRSTAAYQFSEGHFSVNSNHSIPVYLLRQALTRLLRAAVSFSPNARRYYLVRFAATLGEINGIRKASSSLSQQRSD